MGSVTTSAGLAEAQTRPAGSTAAPTAPKTTAAPGLAAAGDAAGKPGAGATGLPPKIQISDPLLAPVPPAAHVVESFRDAIKMINAHSADLVISRAEIERNRGIVRQAQAGALTTITGLGTVGHSESTTPGALTGNSATSPVPSLPGLPNTIIPGSTRSATTNVVATLNVSQPIFAPRAWYSIGTAEAGVRAAKASNDDRERIVITQVANAIVAVFTQERLAEVNRIGLTSALERLDLTQRQFRLGAATRLDVVRAETDAATARSTLISGDENLRQARETLGLAMGSSDGWGVPPSISLDGIAREISGACKAGAPQDRPDVVTARENAEVARRGVQDVKLAFSPTVALTGALSGTPWVNVFSGFSSSDGTTNAGTTSAAHSAWSWNIQAVLSVPLWEGGARYGLLRSAKATADEQVARVDATLRQATVDSVQAVRGVQVSEQARAVSEQTRDLARESAQLAMKSFAAGVGTSFDLVDTGKTWRQAELNLAVAEFNLVQAKLTLVLATATCTY